MSLERLAVILCATGAGLLLAAGCSRESAPAGEPAAASQASGPAGEVLTRYEAIRALLADDKTEGVQGAATQLAEAARTASSSAPDPRRENLTQVASAADQLREAPAASLAEARKRFGEVSRAVVALIAAEPELGAGRYVLECPMAEGYQKWVQTSEQVSNPYFGHEMLECGATSKWSE
jgi:hypothetical protein